MCERVLLAICTLTGRHFENKKKSANANVSVPQYTCAIRHSTSRYASYKVSMYLCVYFAMDVCTFVYLSVWSRCPLMSVFVCVFVEVSVGRPLQSRLLAQLRGATQRDHLHFKNQPHNLWQRRNTNTTHTFWLEKKGDWIWDETVERGSERTERWDDGEVSSALVFPAALKCGNGKKIKIRIWHFTVAFSLVECLLITWLF